jgi:hypothetical protein
LPDKRDHSVIWLIGRDENDHLLHATFNPRGNMHVTFSMHGNMKTSGHDGTSRPDRSYAPM